MKRKMPRPTNRSCKVYRKILTALAAQQLGWLTVSGRAAVQHAQRCGRAKVSLDTSHSCFLSTGPDLTIDRPNMEAFITDKH